MIYYYTAEGALLRGAEHLLREHRPPAHRPRRGRPPHRRVWARLPRHAEQCVPRGPRAPAGCGRRVAADLCAQHEHALPAPQPVAPREAPGGDVPEGLRLGGVFLRELGLRSQRPGLSARLRAHEESGARRGGPRLPRPHTAGHRDQPTSSCSATIETPSHVVTKRRLNKHNVSRKTPCVMTELLCYDLTEVLVRRMVAAKILLQVIEISPYKFDHKGGEGPRTNVHKVHIGITNLYFQQYLDLLTNTLPEG